MVAEKPEKAELKGSGVPLRAQIRSEGMRKRRKWNTVRGQWMPFKGRERTRGDVTFQVWLKEGRYWAAL